MKSPKGRTETFRCKSMTEDRHHVILVPANGHVICSCNGVGWCSHIDATLHAGERHMVPEEDRAAANRAQVLAQGRIGPPEGWVGSWRDNRKWRGLPPLRTTLLDMSRREGRPVMSIEGRGKERAQIVEMSLAAGWMVAHRPVLGALFHVIPSMEADTATSRMARERGIPVATYQEWRSIGGTMASILTEAISIKLRG